MVLGTEVVGSLDEVSEILNPQSGYTDATTEVSFGTARTPDTEQTTFVLAVIRSHSSGGTKAAVDVNVDGVVIGTVGASSNSGALSDNPDVIDIDTVPFIVPPGSSYTLTNVSDPASANAINNVAEMTL